MREVGFEKDWGFRALGGEREGGRLNPEAEAVNAQLDKMGPPAALNRKGRGATRGLTARFFLAE